MTDATTGATDTTQTTTTQAASTGAVSDSGTTQTQQTADTAQAQQTNGATSGATDAADWRAGFDGEIKEFATRFTTVADMAKAAVDLRKANSGMIRVPGKDAKPEDIAKFNKALGVPEKPEEYEFDLGREPTDQDKTVQAQIAQLFHKNGVRKDAAKELSKAVADMAQAQLAEADRVAVKGREDSEAALRKEWGRDFDSNVVLARRAISTFGKDMTDLLNTVVNGAKLGDNPALVRAFGNIGRRMGEGTFIGAVGASEREGLQDRINRLTSENPPGTDKYKQPHIQKELASLYEQLHGTEPSSGMGTRAL